MTTTERPSLPESFRKVVGELPDPGRLPSPERSPFETVRPARSGRVERDGVKLWYAVWGESGPFVAFAPIFQIGHTEALKATVPYLSRHFRVVTMDGRGNGRSDRPEGQHAYAFDHYYQDFVAVLDAVGAERLAVVGLSATAMTALRLAAEQPERVTHVIVAGGYVDARLDDPRVAARARAESERMRHDWPGFLDGFFTSLFTEPHSTKPFEDGVRYAWASTGATVDWCRNGWLGGDVGELARRVRCPTLVIHGDADHRVPYAKGEAVHALVPGSALLTIGGGGHVTAARDPVIFNRSVRDFVAGAPRAATWVRAMSRKRKALFVSSPIGLGHVQRDLAIARELRRLQPDLDIDWLTVDPAAAYLLRENERVHPATARLANESRHLEEVAGEHDLPAFFALRTMDEIMVNNFMTFSDLVEAEHYDLVIGDEAWDVDYHYHENPELKRQPFVFLTDFVGCLPMDGGGEREAHLCADRARGAFPARAGSGNLRRQPRRRHRAAVRARPARYPRLDRPQLRLQRLRSAVRPGGARRHRAAAGEARLSARGARRCRLGRGHGRRWAPAPEDRPGFPYHEGPVAGAAHDPGDRTAPHARRRFHSRSRGARDPTLRP
jgi:pimeloyl-ACP methyl ester carboxylesterase